MYENKKKKRIKLIIIIVIVSLFLLYPFTYMGYYEIQRIILVNNAIKYLENGDKDNFMELFCEKSQQQPTFESDVDDIFSLFDGEITKESWKNIKNQDPWETESGIDYGKYVLFSGQTSFEKISTSKGKSYTINICWYILNDSRPNLEGIKTFTIRYSGTDIEEKCGVFYY